MTKRSTLLTLVAAAFCFGSSFAQVSVKTELPATAAPGGSFTVKLNVAKGDVGGFAKLQQILPPGFSAEAGESANATFSFKDQKVKFLWMALPNNDFQVSYNVSVDKSLSGNQIIEGTFSYIKDNETEKFIIPKDIIAIGADNASSAQQSSMDKILAEQKAKEAAAEAARQEAAPQEEPAEEVAAAQEPEPTPEPQPTPKPEPKPEPAPKPEPKPEPTPAPAPKPEPAPKPAPAPKPSPAPKPAAPDYNDAMMKSKPGLVFRVQIAAGPNQVDPASFQSKYGISDAVVIEEHEGLYKYVVGEFGSYRPAKTYSNELRDGNAVEGPFVTAYNDGVRIHVREALDIAGQ